MERTADPDRLILGRGAQDIGGLLGDIQDHEALGVEHQLRRARIQALQFQRDRAGNGLELKIDPQIQIQMRGSKLIHIGVGVIIKCRIDGPRIGGRRAATEGCGHGERARQDPTAQGMPTGALSRPLSKSLKVFSSTKRPDWPSQLEPSGSVFSTNTPCAMTPSTPS